ESQNPGITNVLVIGPWAHGDWGRKEGDKLGEISFHTKTAEFYREQIELPFFRHFLKDDTNYPTTEAYMFETGANQWRRFDQWPPRLATARTLYFRASGGLDFTASSDGSCTFDEYVSDCVKPVPFPMELTTTSSRSSPVHEHRFGTS